MSSESGDVTPDAPTEKGIQASCRQSALSEALRRVVRVLPKARKDDPTNYIRITADRTRKGLVVSAYNGVTAIVSSVPATISRWDGKGLLVNNHFVDLIGALPDGAVTLKAETPTRLQVIAPGGGKSEPKSRSASSYPALKEGDGKAYVLNDAAFRTALERVKLATNGDETNQIARVALLQLWEPKSKGQEECYFSLVATNMSILAVHQEVGPATDLPKPDLELKIPVKALAALESFLGVDETITLRTGTLNDDVRIATFAYGNKGEHKVTVQLESGEWARFRDFIPTASHIKTRVTVDPEVLKSALQVNLVFASVRPHRTVFFDIGREDGVMYSSVTTQQRGNSVTPTTVRMTGEPVQIAVNAELLLKAVSEFTTEVKWSLTHARGNSTITNAEGKTIYMLSAIEAGTDQETPDTDEADATPEAAGTENETPETGEDETDEEDE